MSYIKSFSGLGKNDTDIAGGKGASLGEMTQAGIPVPDGYVILSSAFERFLAETDLSVEIDAILHSVNKDEMRSVEHASEKIQQLIINATIPSDIATSIKKYFDELAVPYVAVRSSATAEDSTSAAWAGQLESYLNTTADSLLKNVQRCWASLFTPRAIFYRFEKELQKTKISVAVVVQKMIESEISGIAFSVHPVTQDENQLIIEAGFGLGEAIVSGQITPDSYVVEKESRNILDINVHTQTKALYRSGTAGGNTWQAIPEPKASSQVLNREQILELSTIIVQIEKQYGFPCDIEWAYADGKFYIVQSRPITTLQGRPQSKILTNVFSREKSLLYYCMWDDSDKNSVRLLDEKVQNSLFIVPKNGKGSVWYTTDELKALKEKFVTCLSSSENNPAWENIQSLATSSWSFIGPYARQEKSIQSVAEFSEYYNNLVDFWTCLSSFIYEVLDDTSIDPVIVSSLASLRNETEQYTEQMSDVLSNYIKNQTVLALIAKVITVREVKEILSGHLDARSLEVRTDGCFMLNGTVHPLEQLDSVLANNGLVFEQISHSGETLTGTVAFPGLARGSVKIVREFDDLETVADGDILVTEMTNPKYLPAFQKAAAVVTDQGGTLCHAAITARELKKPCIIGTKNATQILKNGDFVEVNADTGLVTILKQTGLLESLKKEDFVFTFESDGTTFIFQDLCFRSYMDWSSVSVCKGTVVRVFVPKSEVVRMHHLGETMTPEFLTEKFNEIRSAYLTIENTIESLRTRDGFSEKELREFFIPLNQICRAYSYFDIHYSDGMFKDGVMTDAGNYVQKTKNELRQMLSNPFFEPQGWLFTGLSILEKQHNVPIRDLEWYTEAELYELCNGVSILADQIAERKKAYTCSIDGELKRTLYVGDQALNCFEMFEHKLDDSVTSLQGIVAHPGAGTVTGRVRIVRKDFADPQVLAKNTEILKEGDILVADTTDPDFLPAMKKAGAIITNVGGLLSHAAITAREINKACIVGTVSATKLLNDGDLVELDTSDGMVKIIERASPY